MAAEDMMSQEHLSAWLCGAPLSPDAEEEVRGQVLEMLDAFQIFVRSVQAVQAQCSTWADELGGQSEVRRHSRELALGTLYGLHRAATALGHVLNSLNRRKGMQK